METYEYKYHKYKNKYQQSKIMTGGNAIGNYSLDKQQYISAMAHNNRIYSYYNINPLLIKPNDFTRETKPNKDKILCVDNMTTFDLLTNRYASLYTEYTDNGMHQYLRLNWDRISRDFRGFYLDNNTLLKLYRNDYAMFKDKRVTSWMGMEQIPLDVMMFR